MDRTERHRLYPLTSIEHLGEDNHNRRFKSFRLRSGWTGEEREKYIPLKHRCPECGGRLSQGDGNYVECEDCGFTGDCDWSVYQAGVGPR